MERSISARGPTQIRRSIFDKQVHCPISFHLCTKFRKGIKNGKSLIPLGSPRLIRKCHSAWESHEVVNTIHKATRNTSGYLSLEFHFHTDTRVRIWPLTPGFRLVDIITNTKINVIGLFYWKYREDGGDICLSYTYWDFRAKNQWNKFHPWSDGFCH